MKNIKENILRPEKVNLSDLQFIANDIVKNKFKKPETFIAKFDFLKNEDKKGKIFFFIAANGRFEGALKNNNINSDSFITEKVGRKFPSLKCEFHPVADKSGWNIVFIFSKN